MIFVSNGLGVLKHMTSEIKNFVNYLRDVKKTSRNTEVSYQRDLTQLAAFLEEKGITEVGKITRTSLNSYILFFGKGREGDNYHFKIAGFHQSIFSFPLPGRKDTQRSGGVFKGA